MADLDPARLVLRPLEEGDAEELLRIRREPEVARWWDAPEPGFPWEEPESTRLTVVVDGAVAGLVQYGEEPEPKYRHASIDIFLDPALHGQGVGTEVIRRVVRMLIDERGHHRVTIDPAAGNVAAVRAYERAGFRPAGVLRRSERDADGRGWHDSLLMELLAGEPVRPAGTVVLSEDGEPVVFAFGDLLRYHGRASPEGVARALHALRRALPLLAPDGPPERRELRVRTAVGDPGALDAFELVARAVTEGRYVLDPTLPPLAFRLGYRGRTVDLLPREPAPDDLMAAAAAEVYDASVAG
jgi:RimJ/RimL family protein N-acetyltransferase